MSLARRAWIVLCLPWLACTVIVDANDAPKQCVVPPGESDPCGAGFACVDNACVPWTSTVERDGRVAPGRDGGHPADAMAVAIGTPCIADVECGPGDHCFRLDIFRLEPADESICSRACCSDADCPEETVCWASGTGAKACIPPSRLGVSAGRGGPLATCAGPEDCRSGVCLASGCLGNCSADADCGDGQTCGSGYAAHEVGDQWQPMCVDGASGLATGTRCRVDEDCFFGSCIAGECGGPCATTADCPDGMYCGWAQDPGPPSSWFQTCIGRENWQDRAVGEACDGDWQSIDYSCIAGFCASSCCTDADCPSGVCRPARWEDAFEMRCMP